MKIEQAKNPSPSQASEIVVEIKKADFGAADLLPKTISNLKSVGLSVDGGKVEKDYHVSYEITDGTNLLERVENVLVTYELVARLNRLVELKFVEGRINSLMKRITALGWQVVRTEGNRGYVEYNHAEDSDFRFTYEDLYALETKLEVAEARRLLIVQRSFVGFADRIVMYADHFVCDGKTYSYNKHNAEQAIKVIGIQNAFEV